MPLKCTFTLPHLRAALCQLFVGRCLRVHWANKTGRGQPWSNIGQTPVDHLAVMHGQRLVPAHNVNPKPKAATDSAARVANACASSMMLTLPAGDSLSAFLAQEGGRIPEGALKAACTTHVCCLRRQPRRKKTRRTLFCALGCAKGVRVQGSEGFSTLNPTRTNPKPKQENPPPTPRAALLHPRAPPRMLHLALCHLGNPRGPPRTLHFMICYLGLGNAMRVSEIAVQPG